MSGNLTSIGQGIYGPYYGYVNYTPYSLAITQPLQALAPTRTIFPANYHVVPGRPQAKRLLQPSPFRTKPLQNTPPILDHVESSLAHRKTPIDRFFQVVSYLAIFGNVLGGASLLASNLPALPKPWKQRAKQTGLAIIAGALALGCVTEIGVGLKQKQPTVTLSNLIFLLATPVFIRDTPLVRGLFLFLMGSYYAGYANIIGNRYDQSQKGGLRQAGTRLTDVTSVLKYIAEDHRQVANSLQRVPSITSGLISDLKRTFQALQSGQKLVIPPSADRVRLSSFCHYAGGAMLMLSSRMMPWLKPVGSFLAGLGGISSNLEWFAVGTQRHDAVGAALKVGMPLQAVGKMLFHTNAGYSVEIMGQGLSYALAGELNQSATTAKARPQG